MNLREQLALKVRSATRQVRPDSLVHVPASNEQEMNLTGFYKLLLPASGCYVLFQNKSHSFFDSLDALTKATLARIDTQGLYFATAAYGELRNRTGDNVIALK